MAESPYKGLTIRFGADTSLFTTRMQAMKSVISSVQSQLRKMNDALKGDPQNVQALTAKFQLLRNQTTNVSASLERMRMELAELDNRGVGKLAAQVSNAEQNFQRCNERVEALDRELEETYARLTQIGKEVDIAFNKEDFEEWYQAVKKDGKAVGELGREIDAAIQKVRSLKDAHHAASEELEKARDVRAYDRLKSDIAQAEAELKGFVAQMMRVREELKATSAEGERLNNLEAELQQSKEESRELHQQLTAVNQALKATGYTNVTNLKKAVELTSKEIQSAYSQLKNMNEQLRILQSQTGTQKVTASMAQLKADVKTANDRLQEQYRRIAQVEGIMRNVNTTVDSYNKKIQSGVTLTKSEEQELAQAQKRLVSMKSDLDAMYARAKVLDDELSLKEALAAQKKLQGELTEANAKMQALTNKTKSFGAAALNSVRDFATGLGATLGPALMMVGTYVVSAGEQIDSAFRDMKKTVNGTEEEFQKLRDAAVEFSKTHPVSADTILEIESIGGQLGILVDELEDFAHIVSNLDIATNMNAEEIALDLGKLRNIFQDLNWDTEAFANSLVRLGNNTPALESDIMNITTRFAGMSAIVGVLPDEVLAIATAASATGQKADAAGGSLQRTFGRIEGAVAGVSEAMRNLDDLTEDEIEEFEKAKDSLGSYAEIAGMSAEEFAKLWTTHERGVDGMTGTTEAFKKFVEGLKRIKDEGGSVDATLQSLGITGVRDRQLLEGLTNTTNVLSDALDMSRNAWSGVADEWGTAGDAAREAAQKSEGFSGKLAMLRNTAQTIGDSFASKLLPVMDELHDIFLKAADAVDKLTEEQAGTIVKVGALTVALAPMLRMVSQTAITLGSMTKGLGESAVRFAGLMDASRQLGEKLSVVKKAGIEVEATNATLGKGVKSLVSSFGQYAKASGESMTANNKLTQSMKTMLASMTAAKAAMLGLAAAGIAIATAALVNHIKKQNEDKKATQELKSATYEAANAFTSAASSVDLAGIAYKDMTGDVDALISKQASLYDELSKSNMATNVSVNMLENWGNALKENSGATEDNVTGVAKLENAVKQLNDQYGTSLQVVKQNGEYYVANADGIRMEADAIDDLIDAKKREVRQTAINNQILKIENQRVEAQQKLLDAQIALAKAQEELNEAMERGDENWGEYSKKVAEAEGNVSRCEDAIKELDRTEAALDAQFNRVAESATSHGQQIMELAEQYPLLASACDQISSDAFPKFIDAVLDAGYSVEDLSGLTFSEVEAMTQAWANGSGWWVDYISNAESDIDRSVNGMTTNTEKAFGKMSRESIKQISEMTGISEDELWELAENADEATLKAMQEVAKNLRDGEPPSKDAASRIRQAVTDQLNRAESDAKTAGSNVGRGFVNGMSGWVSYAATKGYELGASAVAAVNRGAGNASPSKKTRQSGIWIGQGLELGMEKEEKAVEKQAALLGSLAAGAIAAQASASAGYLSARAGSALGMGGATTNNNDNSTENVYITLNVEARDLQDMSTIDDFVAMAKRAKAQYAAG